MSVLILPSIRQDKKEDLATTWDTALTNYATFTKARMPEGEFLVWQQQAYPELRWQRATDLFENGSSPVLGLRRDAEGHQRVPAPSILAHLGEDVARLGRSSRRWTRRRLWLE